VDRVYLVGVLSGRPPEQAHSMVGLDSIEYWGAHGVTHLAHDVVHTSAEAEKFVEPVLHVQRTIEGWDAEEGILIEPKRTSVAVHYRLTADPLRTRDWLYGRLAPLAKANGLDLLEGRKVFELRPPGLGKGWRIQRIIHERGLAGVVYVGDDQTDAEAFAAVDAWRAAGPSRSGVTVAVENSEAPTRTPLSADYTLKGVTAVERLLLGLAERLG
jgi:trehalose 6-phosphate phosphatase